MSPDTIAALVVIDDNGLIVERITPFLVRHGYRVHLATSVREGLDLISEMQPELVMLDFKLTGENVPAVLQKIRTCSPTSYVAISSTMGTAKRAAELFKDGAAECLLKPFKKCDLVNRLDTLLRCRELELNNKRLLLEQEQLLLHLETCQQDFQQLLKEKTESLQKAHFEIAQTEKLAAMGFLAAGMAHDIRNPLNSISLFTQLMRQSVADPDKKEYLGKIIQEVEKIDSIIRTLLDASLRTRSATTDVQIDQVIETALGVFAPQIEAGNIRLERNYQVVPPPIKADPVELEQIFTNLFLNALDEMPDGGRLGIGISFERGMVVVKVEDSGKGIPDQVLPNIFEPFFTTKPRGTGMGLPVVKRIARIYGGGVSVEKSNSAGTVLRLEFPVCSGVDQPCLSLKAPVHP
ncbi:MAG: response regulator [Desulfuromonadales bacterium]|nr:response regulator [Desulfuromonadales bacterium]